MKIEISPNEFSDSAWTELFYAQSDIKIKEIRCKQTKPVQASRKQVENAIAGCKEKIDDIKFGHLAGKGEEAEDDFPWIEDLREAVIVLEGFLKK